MHNGGFLPTENFHDIIPPWKQVKIMGPNDSGPPTQRRKPFAAITYNPALIQITRADQSSPMTAPTTHQPPPPSVAPVGPPPEPAPGHIGLPPFLPAAPRTQRITENQILKANQSHHMQLPTGWFAYISADIMDVYYYNFDARHSQWDFPLDDQMANTWKRKLSTDNLQFFVEYTQMQEIWHRTPQYRTDVTPGTVPPTNLYEDEEHQDYYKTQHIHQSIEQIKHFFPGIAEAAQTMLDRIRNEPTTKPLCFLPRRTEPERLDYDLALYLVQWTPPPPRSLPTVQAVNDDPIIYPYTDQHRLPKLPAVYARHQVVRGSDPAVHRQPVLPPARALPAPTIRTDQRLPQSTTPTTLTFTAPAHFHTTSDGPTLQNQHRQQHVPQPAPRALTDTPVSNQASSTSDATLQVAQQLPSQPASSTTSPTTTPSSLTQPIIATVRRWSSTAPASVPDSAASAASITATQAAISLTQPPTPGIPTQPPLTVQQQPTSQSNPQQGIPPGQPMADTMFSNVMTPLPKDDEAHGQGDTTDQQAPQQQAPVQLTPTLQLQRPPMPARQSDLPSETEEEGDNTAQTPLGQQHIDVPPGPTINGPPKAKPPPATRS